MVTRWLPPILAEPGKRGMFVFGSETRMDALHIRPVQSRSAQIFVSKDALSDDAALQIIDIITTNTDLSTDKIKITEAE